MYIEVCSLDLYKEDLDLLAREMATSGNFERRCCGDVHQLYPRASLSVHRVSAAGWHSVPGSFTRAGQHSVPGRGFLGPPRVTLVYGSNRKQVSALLTAVQASHIHHTSARNHAH